MLELTTCPGCQAELAAPATTELSPARLECPLCGTHFAPQPAKLRRIPAAKVAKPAAPPVLPTPARKTAPMIEPVDPTPVEEDSTEHETVLIPRQQSLTIELSPLELPADSKSVAPERATVEHEVAETVELPPLAQEIVKESAKQTTPTLPPQSPLPPRELPSEPVVAQKSPALPSFKTPLGAEPKTPLTKLADLLDTPQLRPFVAAAKAESPAATNHTPPGPVPPVGAKSPAMTMPEIKAPELKVLPPAPVAPTITKTVEFSSAENAAMLNRDFEFDLSTPEDSQGFNPFESEPAEEATVEVATMADDPTELGWRVSRRLRNAAIVTMFTSACVLGFLAFRPEDPAPQQLESNLLSSATELLSPSDEEPPRTDSAVEPAAFAVEEPAAPVKPVDDLPSLSGAPSYSAEDLVAALEGVTEARDHLQSHSLSEPNEVAALGRNYARLCYLAQVYALLSDEAAADSLRERIQARDQFTLLFESTRARSEIGKIAGPWIAWKDKPHGGVFFCGALPDPIRHGELFEYPFELTPGEVLPVLLEEPVDAEQFGRAGSNVAAVIGVLVENPAERIAGYTGGAPQAVWCRELLPLREARLD